MPVCIGLLHLNSSYYWTLHIPEDSGGGRGGENFPYNGVFGKVRGHSSCQSRTLTPPDAAHQGPFSGKSIYSASAAGRSTSATIAGYR